MATIQLNKGHVTIIDDHLYEYLSQFKWCSQSGYARRQRTKSDIDVPGTSCWIHLHREVLRLNNIEVPKDKVTDHINMDKLDNRFCNLRVASKRLNAMNVSEDTKLKRSVRVKHATLAASKMPRTEKQSEQARATISETNKLGLNRCVGKDNGKSKAIIDTATNIVYDSVQEAADVLGIKYSTLRAKLNGNLKNNTTLKVMDETI